MQPIPYTIYKTAKLYGNTMPRKSQMVGSQTIPGAVTSDSDTDWLILVWSKQYAVADSYFRGFKLSPTMTLNGRRHPYAKWDIRRYSKFVSVRDKDNTNIIFTSSSRFYNKFVAANDLAIKLRLTDKADRIALFQYIIYGKRPQLDEK